MVHRSSDTIGGGTVRHALAGAFVALLLLSGGAAAQSITAVRGLGYPVIPSDARSDALGGLGVGLQGLASPLINPASAAGVLRRGAVMAVQASERDLTLGEATDANGATRFPLIRALFPVGPTVLTLGYGAYLDQGWGFVRTGEQPLGDGTASYRDLVESRGGIGQLQLGLAVPLGSRFALGAAVGAHTGSQDVRFERRFDSTSVGVLGRYRRSESWQYSAPMAQLGFRWDPVDVLRVAGSVTWAGTLEADSVAGSTSSREFELPLQVAGGVSAYLAPGLLAAASGRWSGWSVTDVVSGLGLDPASTSATSGRDTWELGGGLEWDDPDRRAARSFPLRLGFQYRQLPFTFLDDAPNEWFVGGGVGMRVGADAANPVAAVDLTIQRGQRTATGPEGTGDLDESLWRFGLSFSLFGT